MNLLAERVADDDPQVRLEAVRACAGIPTVAWPRSRCGPSIGRWIAFWITPSFKPPTICRTFGCRPCNRVSNVFAGNAAHLTFALQAVGSKDVVPLLMGLLREGKLPPQRTEGRYCWSRAIGRREGFGNRVRHGSVRRHSDRTPQNAVARARHRRRTTPQRAGRKFKPTGQAAESGSRAVADETLLTLAARAAGLWKVESLRPRLTEIATAAGSSESLRSATIESLAALGGSESREVLIKLTAADGPFGMRARPPLSRWRASICPRGNSCRGNVGHRSRRRHPAALVSGFLQRKNGPAALGAALANRNRRPDIAKLSIPPFAPWPPSSRLSWRH